MDLSTDFLPIPEKINELNKYNLNIVKQEQGVLNVQTATETATETITETITETDIEIVTEVATETVKNVNVQKSDLLKNYNWMFVKCKLVYQNDITFDLNKKRKKGTETKIEKTIIIDIHKNMHNIKLNILQKLNLKEIDVIWFDDLCIKYLPNKTALKVCLINDDDLTKYFDKFGCILTSDNKYFDFNGSYMFSCSLIIKKIKLLIIDK